MSDATSTDSARDRRWLILGVIALAQLMVVLDLTVMNIALPSAQRALGFTTVERQWVVTAYTLAFGSLLLPQDVGVASATVTVGQMLGASVGTSLLNTIFASAVASYITAHLAAARLIGRPALTGLALAHGYDTPF